MNERPGRLARQMQRRRRREQLGGSVVVMIGIVVLAFAIVALSHPHSSPSAASTIVTTQTVTASPKSSPAADSRSTTAKPTTTPSPGSTPASAAGASSSTASSGAMDGGRMPLIVLNNTTVTHLAEQAATQFEAGGWTVLQYSNYTNDIISTCAYYDPQVVGAQQSAEQLQAQFPGIKRVEPFFSGLGQYASPIVVILTPDWTG